MLTNFSNKEVSFTWEIREIDTNLTIYRSSQFYKTYEEMFKNCFYFIKILGKENLKAVYLKVEEIK